MRISIIGSGVVGAATGIVFQMKGNEVLFYDIDRKKVEALEKQGYHVTESVVDAVQYSEILFICVPTPTVDGKFDFSFVKNATANIGKALGRTENYKTVIVRSTVLPSTTRCRVLPLLEEYSKLHAGSDFGVCMNPEFLREKQALRDSMNPSRIVIGELDKQSGDLLEQVYSAFSVPIIRTDLDTAEMIKYASNLFLATKISFFNEIYMICEKMSLNANVVSRAVSLDQRIGEYGVYGGRPFDGKCLPKDSEAFRSFVKSLRFDPKLLDAVFFVNDDIRSYTSDRRRKKKTKT